MACKCVAEVNEMLAPRNTRLTQAIVFGECRHERLMVQTEQIESGRGKPGETSIVATVLYSGDENADREWAEKLAERWNTVEEMKG